jgi:hypothetical protein
MLLAVISLAGLALLVGACGSGGARAASVSTAAAAGTSAARGPLAIQGSSRSQGALRMTLYSKTHAQQYLNHEDDRQRGQGNNPFGSYTDAQPTTRETGKGPYPGDTAYFLFYVYPDAKLTKRIGTATLSCTYNFSKNAYCDVSYQLKGGVLTGAGAFNFNTTEFALAIEGGTGTYQGRSGDVEVTARVGDPHVQRLAFVLS